MIYGNMYLNKKYFIHYCHASVSEGLSTELCTSELMLGNMIKCTRNVNSVIV